MKMNKEFVPYTQALALKELGFDEPCFAGYNFKDRRTGQFTYPSARDPNTTSKARVYHKDKKIVGAPTFSQAFRWFREKYKKINYPEFYYDEQKWHCHSDYKGYVLFNTYEEAELACLRKLIEIVKNEKENILR